MILVTGASGFIGSNFCDKLDSLNIKYTGVCRNKNERFFDLDLSDYYITEKLIDFVMPTTVVHFASNPNTKIDDDNPSKIIDDNIKSTMNILSCLKHGTRFVLASSVTVYGNNLNNTEESKCDPKSIYASTKLASENIVNFYSENNGIKGVILRLCATIGKNSTHGMIHDFSKKIKDDSDYFKVFGNKPGAFKPFLHVDDLCSAILHLIDEDLTGVYNICPSDNISVLEVAEMFLRKYKSNKKIKWSGDMWTGDNPKILCLNSKIINSGFNFNFKTSKQAIEEYLKNA